MRVCYYALKKVQVGHDWREPGDLVPEANSWPFLAGYVRDGLLAPVLVATLPEDAQQVLAQWEEDQQGGSRTAVQAKKGEKAAAG